MLAGEDEAIAQWGGKSMSVSERKRSLNGLRFCRLAALAISVLAARRAEAGEGPFFVTYTHQMEEPGNLEVATKNVTGKPGNGDRFLGHSTELEYGVTGWWTSEWYLDGQATSGESALFTGYRWENRFRLLPREHWINPVLYIEFENINGADKSLLEIVNHDGRDDLTSPNEDARNEKKRELEAKLILGSYVRGWTIAENFIAEKNVRHEPFEFGYAVGVSRPLGLAAKPERCNFCAENLQLGVEMYGSLCGANSRLDSCQRDNLQDLPEFRTDRYQRQASHPLRRLLRDRAIR
jgi:hypothetical protein